MSNRCCCGRYEDTYFPFIHNDIMHEVYGPPGNFCGFKHLHIIRDLEIQLFEARQAILKEGLRVEQLTSEIKKLREDSNNESKKGLQEIQEKV
jgi:hypothetical protein